MFELPFPVILTAKGRKNPRAKRTAEGSHGAELVPLRLRAEIPRQARNDREAEFSYKNRSLVDRPPGDGRPQGSTLPMEAGLRPEN